MPGKLAESLVGRVYGRLTVTEFAGRRAADRTTLWKVRCECGTVKTVERRTLIRGKARSCGCLVADTRHTTHGLSYTPEYKIWRGMIDRCTFAKRPSFSRYGGRGITVSPEWRGSTGFERFIEHVGQRPSSKHELDRIDPDGHYEPGNVRWVTKKVNGRNKSDTITLTFEGVTQSLADWADAKGLRWCTLYCRLFNYGWTLGRALNTPKRARTNKR